MKIPKIKISQAGLKIISFFATVIIIGILLVKGSSMALFQLTAAMMCVYYANHLTQFDKQFVDEDPDEFDIDEQAIVKDLHESYIDLEIYSAKFMSEERRGILRNIIVRLELLRIDIDHFEAFTELERDTHSLKQQEEVK